MMKRSELCIGEYNIDRKRLLKNYLVKIIKSNIIEKVLEILLGGHISVFAQKMRNWK